MLGLALLSGDGRERGDPGGGLPLEPPGVNGRHEAASRGAATPARSSSPSGRRSSLVSGLASLAGYALFDTAGDKTVAFVLAFAGGAVLTMLADTMLPEAVEHGGKLAGLVTTFGFAVAVAFVALEGG